MKRSRFSEEQIIGILKEHQAGMTAVELCRKHGISDATFYTWRKKYGGKGTRPDSSMTERQTLRTLRTKKDYAGALRLRKPNWSQRSATGWVP